MPKKLVDDAMREGEEDPTLRLSKAEERRLLRALKSAKPERPPRQAPLTPRVKQMLEMAQREARRLHHTSVRADHILLAVINYCLSPEARNPFSGFGPAMRRLIRHQLGSQPPILQSLGISPRALRAILLRMMRDPNPT